MKIIIVGSRNLKNYYSLINKAINFSHYIIERKKIERVVCLDKLVQVWAKQHSIKTKLFLPDWLDIASPDAIIEEREGVKINLRAPQNRDDLAVVYSQGLIAIYKRQIINNEFVDDKNLDYIINKMKELNKKVSVMEVDDE